MYGYLRAEHVSMCNCSRKTKSIWQRTATKECFGLQQHLFIRSLYSTILIICIKAFTSCHLGLSPNEMKWKRTNRYITTSRNIHNLRTHSIYLWDLYSNFSMPNQMHKAFYKAINLSFSQQPREVYDVKS